MCHSSNWQTISRNPATQRTAFPSATERHDSRGGRLERERGGAVFSEANVSFNWVRAALPADIRQIFQVKAPL